MTILLALVLQQGPSIDADAGFFGHGFPDAWARLSAVVSNPRDEIEGELRVTVRSPIVEPVVYRRSVTLPAKVRKRFSWDVFLSGSENEAEFELVGKGGKVLARNAVPITFSDRKVRQILQVGTALSSLVDLEERLEAAFAQTGPDRLPDSAPPLLALDAIVFPEARPLEPAQEEALLRWVERGGRLVFAPGRTAAFQGRFWRDLCPLDRVTTERIAVGEEGIVIPMAAGRLRAGGAFLTLGGRPAGFRAPRGRGEVVFLAFPLDQEGLEEVLAPATLWHAVLDPTPAREETVIDPRRAERRFQFEGPATMMWGLAPEEATLPAEWLLLGGALLLVYVGWIGPWHYFRLKHGGRLRRGAVAFGAVAGVFLALSVAWAGVFGSRATTFRHLVIADEGLVQTFSVIQAGESRLFDLEARGAVSPLGEFLRFGPAPRPCEAREPFRAQIPLAALATRGIVTARVPGPAEFAVSCRWESPGVLEMVNDGPVDLVECRLVTRDGMRLLGDLDAKTRRSVTVSEMGQRSFKEWYDAERRRDRGGWAWWGPGLSWREREPEEHAFYASFYERLQRSTGYDSGLTYRFSQRGIDLSARLERGESFLVGRFEGDHSGLRLEQRAEVRTYGIVRVAVPEEKR